jgi:uncharacterized cupredoxin-like copper-binding protein
MLTVQNRPKFVAVIALAFTSIALISLAIADAQETPTPSASPMASPQASPVAGGQPQTAVTVTMVDIAFEPNEFTVAANTDVTITLTNAGAALHTFVVSDHNNEGKPNLGIKVEVQPGQTGTTTVNAPPGDYYFYCDVPGHEQAGMFGTMHVQ